ncbi:MAG: hypothetical protein H6710_13380 [Myxococcales bacterium]|nr:hypothetical protein [Myxococcales bacterium]
MLVASLVALVGAAPPATVNVTPGPIAPEIVELDHRQHRIQSAGMFTLTGWGIANIVGGVAGNLATPRGEPARYFHQMNALWNTVNLTLGAIGLRNARRARPSIGRRDGVIREVSRTQRVFAVNALLDVAYMLGGYATWEIGKERASPRLRGYGAAVVFQGAFLIAFDLAMIAAHERSLRRSGGVYRLSAAPTPGGAALALSGAF